MKNAFPCCGGFIQAGRQRGREREREGRLRIAHVFFFLCVRARARPPLLGIKVKSNTSVSVWRPAASIPLTTLGSYMELRAPAVTTAR